MPISEPVELKLRIKKSKKQGEGKLLEYMLNHPTLGSADAVMEACRAYWMPLAFVREGENNAAVLREVGWKAIGELEMQIKLIKRVLQLSLAPSDIGTPMQSSERKCDRRDSDTRYAFRDDRTEPMAVASVPAVTLADLRAIDEKKTLEELDEELGANDF